MRAKGLRHKSQSVKYRIYEATEQTDGKHDKNKETTIEMTAKCAKPSRCWARRGQSWAQRKEKWRRNKEELGGGGEAAGWVQVRRGKNPRQREKSRQRQRQNRRYNYEQARSTRHAGRLADSEGSVHRLARNWITSPGDCLLTDKKTPQNHYSKRLCCSLGDDFPQPFVCADCVW